MIFQNEFRNIIPEICKYLFVCNISNLAKTCSNLNNIILTTYSVNEDTLKDEIIERTIHHSEFSITSFKLSNLYVKCRREYKQYRKIHLSKLISLLNYDQLKILTEITKSEVIDDIIKYIMNHRFRYGCHSLQINYIHLLIEEAEIFSFKQVIKKLDLIQVRLECEYLIKVFFEI